MGRFLKRTNRIGFNHIQSDADNVAILCQRFAAFFQNWAWMRVSGNSTPNTDIPALKPHKIGGKKRVYYMCIFRQVISDVIVIASVVK